MDDPVRSQVAEDPDAEILYIKYKKFSKGTTIIPIAPGEMARPLAYLDLPNCRLRKKNDCFPHHTNTIQKF